LLTINQFNLIVIAANWLLGTFAFNAKCEILSIFYLSDGTCKLRFKGYIKWVNLMIFFFHQTFIKVYCLKK